MSVRELLEAGGDDMVQELGVRVTILRKGKEIDSVYAVVSSTEISYRVELGGVEREVNARGMCRRRDLQRMIEVADRLVMECRGDKPWVYYVKGVEWQPGDAMVHLELAR